MARRESYQSVIDKSRDEELPAAEPARGGGQPPHARKSYPRKRALNRQLARHYEQCKQDTSGRFRSGRRQKQYCSAVAWKRAEQSGKFSDYPTFRSPPESTSMRRTPRRNRKGQFVKGGGEARRRPKGRARAGEARRRPRSRAAAYESPKRPRRGKARRARAASPRRAAPRRTGRSRGRSQTNIAIVPVGVAKESRRGRGGARRYRRAREPMMVGAGGVAMFTAGAILGDLIADVIDRYIGGYDPNASPAPTLPAPYTVDTPIPKWNNDSAAMQPGVWRILAQLGGALVFFGLGAMVSKSMALKFFLYGVGGGFTIHVSTQIVTAYIIVPMVKGSTATGARLYQHEINVYNGLANPSGGILGLGPANKPGGARRGLLGAPPVNSAASPPPALPANQPARMPVALASQPSPAAAERPAQQQPPAMLQQQPPAQQQQQQQPAAQPQQPPPAANGQPVQAHPLWSVLLERQAA